MKTDQRSWLEPPMVQVPEALRAQVGGHPLVAETLFRRGIRSTTDAQAFLDPSFYQPSSPTELPDLKTAVDLIANAVLSRVDICVWGDFDVDGQTSTTLLVEALRDLGASVRFYIPDREIESHGFHAKSLKELLDQGVRLIVTCDTGVTGHDAVELARSFGAQVIITDHHDLPSRLPAAAAVLNPKRLAKTHPLRELPGVGVAYELAQGCYQYFARDFPLQRNAELAALGIVADLAVQVSDVRYLLQRGLDALRTTSRPALLSLFDVSGLSPGQVDEEQITFSLAPRLNSLGRMDDASKGVDFLLSSDTSQAIEFAAFLDQLNTRRKLLTDQIFQAAIQQVESTIDKKAPALVVVGQNWPGGILGIVASRLVETYGKPALVLSQNPEGKIGGSARSIPGIDISAAISSVGELLMRYGGHPMAAGLQMSAVNYKTFEKRIQGFIQEQYGEVLPPGLQLDGYLSLSDLDLDVMGDFARLAPFGPGNPDLVFACRGYEITEIHSFGAANEHQRLFVEDENGRIFQLIRWRGSTLPSPQGRVDIAYSTRINRFRGEAQLQVEWVDARPHEQVEVQVRAPTDQFVIQDWRWISHPQQQLAALDPSEPVEIWVEGLVDAKIAGSTRSKLQPASVLIIWTAPPDRKILLHAIRHVQPTKLIVVGLDPDCGQFEVFLRQLAGMVKYVLGSRDGVFDLNAAAEKLGSLAETVRVGLHFLRARGMLEILEERADELRLNTAAHQPQDVTDLADKLQAELLEAAAFRSYLKKCDLVRLLGEMV